MGYPHKFKRGSAKPRCKACGVACKTFTAKYCSMACVPRQVRADACKKGRKTFAYRRRAQAFRDDLARLGRTPTREDLVTILHRVYKRGYNTGYQVAARASTTGDAQALARAKERDAA